MSQNYLSKLGLSKTIRKARIEMNIENLLQMESGEELDTQLMFIAHPDIKFSKDAEGQWWGDYGKPGFNSVKIKPSRYSRFFDEARMLIHGREDLSWWVSGNGLKTMATIMDSNGNRFSGHAGPHGEALAFCRAFVRLFAGMTDGANTSADKVELRHDKFGQLGRHMWDI